MTFPLDLLDRLRPVLTEEDAVRILKRVREDGLLSLPMVTLSLPEAHPLHALENILASECPEPDELALILQGRRLGLPEILLWFLVTQPPTSWFPATVRRNPASIRDLPTPSSSLQEIAALLTVPAPPPALDVVALDTLTLAWKAMSEEERQKIHDTLHPRLQESLRECGDYMGPVRVSDAEEALDTVKQALQP